MYKEIVSSLEKWSENPAASCEPYAAMRRAYPAGQSDVANKNDVSSDRYVFVTCDQPGANSIKLLLV